MIDINKYSSFKYILFGSLYFLEGLQLAIATVIIPIYLLEKNFPPKLATFVIGMILIPWAIKFVFGWIVDYSIQLSRKQFILSGGIISSVSLIVIAFVDPSVSLISFLLLLFIGHCGIGFLDVSADAWAIESSHEKERGKLNGVMTAGLFTGMTIGTTIIALTAQSLGYNIAFLVAGLLSLPIILFPLFIKEIKKVKKHQKIALLIISEFRKKTTQSIAVFLPIVLISSGIIQFAVPIYMKINLQFDIGQIGLIATIFVLAKVFGSLVCGTISDKWGRKTAIYIILGLSIFFSASLISANNWQLLSVLYGIIGFLSGGLLSVLMATCMDITNPKIGATQFSILMSLANAGELGGGATSGTLISLLGFSRVFLYSAWIFGPALIILYFIKFKKQTRRISHIAHEKKIRK